MPDENLLNNELDADLLAVADRVNKLDNKVSGVLSHSCPCMCLICLMTVLMAILIGILTLPAMLMQCVLNEITCTSKKERQNEFRHDHFSDVTPEVQAQTDNYSEMYAEKGFFPNWIFYVKQTHPVLAICLAERSHPYSRRDRVVQLFLLQGIGYAATVFWHMNKPPPASNRLADLLAKNIFMMFASTLPQFIAAQLLMKVALLSYRKWQVDHEDAHFDLRLSKWLLDNIFLDAEREPDAKKQDVRTIDIDAYFDSCMEWVKESLKEFGVYLIRVNFAGYMGALGVCLFFGGFMYDAQYSLDHGEDLAFSSYGQSTIISWFTFFILSFLQFGARWKFQHMSVRKQNSFTSLSLPVVGRCGIVHDHDIMVKLCDAKRLANTVRNSGGDQMKVTYEEFEEFVKMFAAKEHLGHMLPPSFKVSVGDTYEYYVGDQSAGLAFLNMDPGWFQVRVTGVDGNQISVALGVPNKQVNEYEMATVLDAIKNGVPKTSLKSKAMLLDNKNILSTFQRIDGNSDGMLTIPDFVLWATEVDSQIQGYRPMPPSAKKFVNRSMRAI